jgi:hypothetical protein
MWNDFETKLLIEERRAGNTEFWGMAGRSRVSFWTRIAGMINSTFMRAYTAEQCKEKFQNLVRENMVRKITECCDRIIGILIYIFLIS